MRENERIVKKTEKQFHRMLRYLKKKKLYDGTLHTWQDELSERMRFVILPGLVEAVEKFWDTDLAPFVIEILYTMDTICYRNQIRNLFGMFICESEKSSDDKTQIRMALLSLAFELQVDNAGFIQDIDWSYYDRVKTIVEKLKGDDWERYYQQIVEPIVVQIAIKGRASEIFQTDSGRGILEHLKRDEDLDDAVVQFLAEDAWDYVDGCDCFSYNPGWLFGSGHYKEVVYRLRTAIKKQMKKFDFVV